jgi:hypothetical protein
MQASKQAQIQYTIPGVPPESAASCSKAAQHKQSLNQMMILDELQRQLSGARSGGLFYL